MAGLCVDTFARTRYIYIERERESERSRDAQNAVLSFHNLSFSVFAYQNDWCLLPRLQQPEENRCFFGHRCGPAHIGSVCVARAALCGHKALPVCVVPHIYRNYNTQPFQTPDKPRLRSLPVPDRGGIQVISGGEEPEDAQKR